MSVSKRTFVKICTFAIALTAVLGVRNIMLMSENKLTARALEYSYLRAVEELSTYVDNINNTLQKQLYAGTADMQESLAQKLLKDASSAKDTLSQLPVEEFELENTNKFLSQVGNYALSLSEKAREGEEITDEEYEALAQLHEFSSNLCDDMWELEKGIYSGEISLSSTVSGTQGNVTAEQSPNVTEGFTDFEEGFDSYPTLIYDGPFSDNILEQTPRMTENAEEVTEQKALERCSMALNINATKFTEVTEENGKMPSWVFSDGEAVTCGVTKNGGYISYFLKSRQVATAEISQSEALAEADKFLEELGILSMTRTYYEEYGGVLTVNYAYSDNGICCYTDLVKVSVAMDNGEILSYDARGFLVNHYDREYPDGRISVLDAQQELSPMLEVNSRRLAVIPSDGTEEIICYEFNCTATDGTDVLVYVNAYTGKEEQILILIETAGGTTTM